MGRRYRLLQDLSDHEKKKLEEDFGLDLKNGTAIVVLIACPDCHLPLEFGWRFCPKCGKETGR